MRTFRHGMRSDGDADGDACRALGYTPGARRGANANVMPMYDARRALGYTPGAAPIPMV